MTRSCVIGQLAWLGQLNAIAAARQIIRHRTACYSQHDHNKLVPLPVSRSICLNTLMVSLLFAGITISSFIAR
ncbi:hypothetical protein LCM4577_16225 [Mesorhizobium sp. LCM 4577]|nr:hypothetical protein LCM4577_16225 [Mesorhizobium sp. LCM 4577]